MTLVELVVSMLLVAIIMAMVVGILSPAAKIFLRMQKLQYAQQILDNTAAQLQDMAGGSHQICENLCEWKQYCRSRGRGIRLCPGIREPGRVHYIDFRRRKPGHEFDAGGY